MIGHDSRFVAEPELFGSGFEEQLPAGGHFRRRVGWRKDFDADFRGDLESELAPDLAEAGFRIPADIDRPNSVERGNGTLGECESAKHGAEPEKNLALAVAMIS